MKSTRRYGFTNITYFKELYMNEQDQVKRPNPLSSRQMEILTLSASGLTAQEIAETLSMSSITVRIHLRHIRMTLGAKNTAHAVAIAFSQGWLMRTNQADPPSLQPGTLGYGKSCFIAAPSGANLDALISVLEEVGIEPIIPSILSIPGKSLLEYISDSIAQTDLMVAVIGTEAEEADSNVLFELGQAYALKKRILVLVKPSTKKLPFLTQELLYLRTELENRDAILFVLDQLMKRPVATRQRQGPLPNSVQPLGSFADVLLDRLKSLPSNVREQQLIEITTEALRASGISIIIEQPTLPGGLRPDLAVWADDLEAWLGDPLLVEVKNRLRSEKDVESTRNQVMAYMRSSNVPRAMVIYREAWKDDFDPVAVSFPYVYFVQLGNLLDNLRTQSFSEVVLDLRNRVAHGR
jgi:DNA-binding CsgD family transcriptional regulator